jgi:uncharacterized protein (TIGR00303 family)
VKIKAAVETVFTIDSAADLVGRAASALSIQFVLALAGTKVSDIDGISAAGSTPESRRLTPALDADALVNTDSEIDTKDKSTADKNIFSQENIFKNKIPVSPVGIASPVVLSRAALSLIPHSATIVDCGTFKAPRAPHKKIGDQPANSIAQAAAMTMATVQSLYQAGLRFGQENAHCQPGELDKHSEPAPLVLAECVPGGTTTASAVCTAFGMDVTAMLSSSLPAGNVVQKKALIEEAMKSAAIRYRLSEAELPAFFRQNPFEALAAFGDPMQVFFAGVIAGRGERLTILAGGSQMLALWAVAKQIAVLDSNEKALKNLFVATSKWIAEDKSANTRAMAELVGAPFFASRFSLAESKHEGLRAYEDGNVKEGVGAGALLMLAHLIGNNDERTTLQTIDSYYSVMTE